MDRTPKIGSRTRSLLALGLITATAGMLIWSKLRLVSGLPRSAYAVPEQAGGEAPEPTEADGTRSTLDGDRPRDTGDADAPE